MASFEAAIAVVLGHEVGPNNDFFSNHVADPGGPTAWGVTAATYSAWLKRTATIDEVKTMPLETAKNIYKISYWGLIQGDAIKSEALATNFMDMAVLRGVVAASKTMQGCLGVVADGAIGPKTLAAISAQNPAVLIVEYFEASQRALAALVVASPAKIVFLNTWMRRVADMLVPIKRALRQSDTAQKTTPA